MFDYSNGVHLRDSTIWFDAFKKKKLSFITNALATDFVKHEKVITTPQTYKLLERRLKNVNVLTCPYNHVFNLGNIEVELLPSGFILGSCQVLLFMENTKILYTSDFNLDVLQTSENIEITECDILIIKSIYGKKQYFFPSTDIALNPIIGFISNCFDQDLIPVLLVEPLGNSQELAKLLISEGYKICVHDTIYRNTNIYKDFGIELYNYSPIKGSEFDSRVLLIPPDKKNESKFLKIDGLEFANISESAMRTKKGSDVKYNFPFSIRPGYDQMIKFVKLVNPKEVYVTGNMNVEFANDLKEKGFKANILQSPEQLSLI